MAIRLLSQVKPQARAPASGGGPNFSGTFRRSGISTESLITGDNVVRRGLRGFLELEVVGEASNGEEAMDMAQNLHPDVRLGDRPAPGFDPPFLSTPFICSPSMEHPPGMPVLST